MYVYKHKAPNNSKADDGRHKYFRAKMLAGEAECINQVSWEEEAIQ